MMIAATTNTNRRSTWRFHHGLFSSTSYAVFSDAIREPKMFEPDHAASSAPTDITPGAFSEYTTFWIASASGFTASPSTSERSCQVMNCMT
jgi:hypothetical protein